MADLVLNYAGTPGIADMGAFNARLQIIWKGDHLFRIYPVDDSLYFIRVGGSKRTNAAVGAQFGLLGALLIYFSNKRTQKKTQQTLNQIAGVDPRQLLQEHKLNFVLPIKQIASAELTAGSFWSGSKFGKAKITDMTGKKRLMTFDDMDNMKLAVEILPPVLEGKLHLNAQWDDQKQKFRKIA